MRDESRGLSADLNLVATESWSILNISPESDATPVIQATVDRSVATLRSNIPGDVSSMASSTVSWGRCESGRKSERCFRKATSERMVVAGPTVTMVPEGEIEVKLVRSTCTSVLVMVMLDVFATDACSTTGFSPPT